MSSVGHQRWRTSRLRAVVALVLGAWTATGCHATLAPVLNVVDAPVAKPDWGPVVVAAGPRTQGTVRVAILQALAAKTWTVDQEQMGLILATVQTPPHYGQIAITYSDGAYSIYHRGSSPTLKFDGTLIHRRYNNWIAQLRKSIDENLDAAFKPTTLTGPVPPGGAQPAPAAGGWPAASGSVPAPAPGGWPAPAPGAPPATPSAPPPRGW
jgi:hypothetical protein